MAKTQQAQVVITANAKVAQAVMKALQGQIDQTTAHLKQLVATGQANSKEAKEAKKYIVALNGAMQENISHSERVSKALNNLSGTSLNQLRRALAAAKSELNKLKEDDEPKKIREAQQNVATLQKQIDKLTGTVSKGNSAWKTAVQNITAYVGVFQAFNFIKGKITDFFKMNFEFSDQLTNIRKVSGLTTRSVDNLAASLGKIETRSTVQELNNLAYAGAKLGIGDYGAAALEGFVKAADQVNVALKEDLGDEALTALSKMTATMGLIPKMGVEQSMLKVGSAMFKLASTSTATSANIVEFSKRLTGIARNANITTPELLALGSAADSLMLMPEVASTTFNKLITQMKKAPEGIEQSLGMVSGSIHKLMSEGKTMEVIVDILKRMHDAGSTLAIDHIYKDLGSDGARMIGVMETMSRNYDVLEKHIRTSNQAFREGTAVTAEYRMQQETAAAYMERARNLWMKSFINPEGVDTVKELAVAWYDLSKSMTENKVTMGLVKVIIQSLVKLFSMLLTLLPAIASGLMIHGAAALWTSIGASIGMTGDAAVSATLKTKGLTAAWRELNMVQQANVIGLVVSLLMTLAIVIADVIKKTSDATSYMKGFTNSYAEFNGEVNKANIELDQYYKAILQAHKGTKLRQVAIDNFNDKFGGYLKNLLSEKSTVDDIRKAYQEAAKAIRQKIALQLKEKDMEKYVNPRVMWSADKLETYDQIAGNAGMGAMNGSWLQQYVDDMRSAGKSLAQINADLAQKLGVGSQIASDAMRNRGRGVPTTYTDSEKVTQQITNNAWLDNASLAVSSQAAAQANTRQLTGKERMLYAAMNYATQSYSTSNALTKVNNKWDRIIGDYTDEPEQEINPTPDGGGASGKTGKVKVEDPYKKEKDLAEKRAQALLANIEAFYEEQKRKYLEWVQQMNADGETVTEAQQKLAMEQFESKKKTAMGNARESIASLGEAWNTFKKEIPADVFGQVGETDKRLMQDIEASDIEELHKLFEKVAATMDGGHEKLKENLGAWLDQIFKNGVKDLRAVAEQLVQHQRDIQKIVDQYDYTGSVNRATRNNLETMQLLPVGDNVDATTVAGNKAIAKSYDDLTRKVRENIVAMYEIDPAAENFEEQFKGFLKTTDSTFDFSKLTLSELKALYIELIKYSDNYTAAQKQQHDRQQKILDQQWKNNPVKLRFDRQQNDLSMQTSGVAQFSKLKQGTAKDQNGNALPAGDTRRNDLYGTGSFISSMGHDPEIDMYRAKMDAAAAYYDFLKAHNADEESLRAAYDATLTAEIAYAKSVSEQMKGRISDVMELASPVEDFGTSMGEAFATMTEDAEEGRKAVKKAVGDMINAFLKQTVDMTTEYAKRRIMQQMNDRLTAMEMRRAQAEQQAIRDQQALAEQNGTTFDMKDKATRKAVKERTKYYEKNPEELNKAMAANAAPTMTGPTGASSDPIHVIIDGGMPVATDANGNPVSADGGGAGGGAPIPPTNAGAGGAGAPVNAGAGGAGGAPVNAGGGGAGGGGMQGAGGSAIMGSANAMGNAGAALATGDAASAGATLASGAVGAAGGSLIDAGMGSLEKSFQKKKKITEKGNKDIQKSEKKAAKAEEKIEKGKQDSVLDTAEEGGEAREFLTEEVGGNIQEATADIGQQTLETQQAQTQQEVQMQSAETQANTTMGIASGASKIIGSLGWWGIPLVAVITALLNGLLSFAMSKVSSLFGGGSDSADSGPQTKLVTGMLTYDSGNVQQFSGVLDGKTYPVVGNDGNVYAAKDGGELSTGLVKDPITTMVNGQPALVAEKRPEMIIGGETTAAMMMDNPGLMQEIVQYDKNRSGRTYKAYDSGNVADFAGVGAGSGFDASGLQNTIDTLSSVLTSLQQNGIRATVQKYGRGGVVDAAADGANFMKKNSGDRLWRR